MTRLLRSSFSLITFFVLGLCVQLRAENVFDEISDEVRQVYQIAAPSVVQVRARSDSMPLAGTGFFIDDKGSILTSAAIIGDAYQAKVEYQKRSYDALVLSKDPRSGVALLKIEATGTPSLKMGDSDQIKLATGVISVAYPYNLPAAPNFGLVAGFDVQYLNHFFATTHMRANVAVSPGQIGGPLLNSKGEVVGIMMVAIDDGKACYALPINAAKKIVDDMMKYGMARHGWVGVGVVQDTAPSVGREVKVSQLFDGTPAKNSGIEPGDRVLKIGDRTINQPSDVLDAAFYAQIGEDMPVEVERNGKMMVFNIKVKERPSAARLVQVTPLSEPSGANPIPSTLPSSSSNEVLQVKGSK